MLGMRMTRSRRPEPSALGHPADHSARRDGPLSLHTPGGYYINAAQAGEPPGRWWGPGAQALGFTSGQVVERKPYDAVYQKRDPRTEAKLGRARGRYATFAAHLAQLTAAEPHATAERVIELEREAAQATRQPAAYTDVTVSFSKSISVLHASIRENARRARLSGDGRALGYWSGRALGYWSGRALGYWSGREQKFQEVLHRARQPLSHQSRWLFRTLHAAGLPATSAGNCGWPGSAPPTPNYAPSEPTSKPTPPARPTTMPAPSGTRNWLPPTGR
jgi:hypothetical protein